MPDSIPIHPHGLSKYYYDKGCTHPLCLRAAARAKAANRARRRAERVLVDGRWIHPDLAAFDSDSPRRHGTQYARTTFQCQCEHCKPSRPDLVAFPGTSLLWAGHVDDRVAGSIIGLALVVVMMHIAPMIDVHVVPPLLHVLGMIHPPRVSMIRFCLVALTAYTAAPLVVSVALALVVAAVWPLIRRDKAFA